MADRRDGLLCHIAGHGYTVDTELVDWTTVAVGRQSVDQGAAPGEQALSNENIWRRSRDDGIDGAGQDYADLLQDESSIFRWRNSKGINPWTRRQFTLLDSTLHSLTNTALLPFLLTATQSGVAYLFTVDGSVLKRTTDPFAEPATWTSFTGTPTNAFTDCTTDGQTLWLCDGAGVYKVTSGTALGSAWSSVPSTIVGYANGRLLAAHANDLFELDNTGAMTSGVPLFTHPSSLFAWAGIASSPAGIYSWGSNGQRSEIYVTTAIDSTGALDVPFFAGSLPDGETLLTMCFYLGVVVLGTTRGVRLAQVTGGGFLSYGPVIEAGGGSVTCLEPQGEDVWFGWHALSLLSANSCGLGRVRLSRFTSDLVPSFASDLQVSQTNGPFAVVTFNNRRVFSVSQHGVYAENTSAYVAQGIVDYGWFTFGIPEAKSLDTVSVWTDELPSGTSVTMKVYTDDATSPSITGVLSSGSSATFAASSAVSGERFRVTATLATSDTSVSPTLRRMTLRAVPAPFISQQMVLPIKLADDVRDEQGANYGMDPWAEWQFLQGLVGTRQRVTLTLGSFTATVRLDALQVNPSTPYTARYVNGWDDRHQFLKGTWLVTATTVEEAT